MAAPSLVEVRAWVDVSVARVSDAQLAQVVAAERANQARLARVPADPADYPDDLAQALFRRVARVLAAKAIPTGLVGDAEYGMARLPMFDAEIARLEGPRMMVVFG